MPENLTAEQAVLGMALADPDCARLAAAELRPAHFARVAHRRIAEAIIELLTTGREATIAAVASELDRRHWLDEVGGVEYLQALVAQWRDGALPTLMRTDLRTLKDLALRRWAMRIADELYRDAPEAPDIAERIGEAVNRLADLLGESNGKPDDYYGWLAAEMARDGEVIGPRLGVSEFDRLTGGLGSQRLVIVQGPTKFGKSTFAEQIIWSSVSQGLPMAFVVLEGSKKQRYRRYVAWQAQVVHAKLAPGRLKPDQAEATRIREADKQWRQWLEERLLLLRDDLRHIDAIEGWLRWAAREQARRNRQLAGVVIDYAQVIEGGRGRTEVERYRDIAARLQHLADDLQLPIIVPSQITVTEDGEVRTYGARAWQHNATLVIGLLRGRKGQTVEERRRSPILRLACIAARDMEPFGKVELRLLGWCHRIVSVQDYERLEEADAQ